MQPPLSWLRRLGLNSVIKSRKIPCWASNFPRASDIATFTALNCLPLLVRPDNGDHVVVCHHTGRFRRANQQAALIRASTAKSNEPCIARGADMPNARRLNSPQGFQKFKPWKVADT